ncbi:hypothetical protein RJZ90_002918, partial [Blastomyces dermatitidis]
APVLEPQNLTQAATIKVDKFYFVCYLPFAFFVPPGERNIPGQPSGVETGNRTGRDKSISQVGES